MNQYQHGPVPPAPPSTGLTPGVAVLLWIVAGWPLSWLLLFLSVPLGILFGVGITIWMIVVCAGGGGRPMPAVVITVGPVAGTPVPWSVAPPPDLVRRRQVEGLAHIDAVGGCGWCGSPSAHVNDVGYQVHPRHWHAAEIEERLRADR